MQSPLTVVKVGGSLYDLPDLGRRLQAWLEALAAPHVLLVPGGGALADVVRDLDRIHGLGEERSHWLALQALALNAAFLSELIPDARVVQDWQTCLAGDCRGRVFVLDCLAFARADEARSGCLPHSWAATSDAIAARVAAVARAATLILLKSVAIPADTSWEDAARRGWVDPLFARLVPAGITARAHNLREWPARTNAEGS